MDVYSFNRSYTLTIEEPPEITSNKEATSETPLEESTTKTSSKEDFTEIEEAKAITFTGLQIRATTNFKERSGGKDPIGCLLTIYNLNRESINHVVKINSLVTLEAGYGDNQKTIFTGQVYRSSVVRNGADLVTELQCKDGGLPLTSILVSKSFPKDTLFSDIFQYAVDQFKGQGISSSSESILLDKTPENASEAPDKVKTVKTYSMSGYLREALTELCEDFQYKYQIVNSTLYIYPEGYQEMYGQVELVSENILSIGRLVDNTENASDALGRGGVEVRVLLDGSILGMSQVKISLEDGHILKDAYDGVYKVRDLRHELNFEGTEWTTTLLCDAVEEGI